MYLNRKMRAWIGWRAARESGSREYRSSTMNGSPSVLSSSLWRVVSEVVNVPSVLT